MRKKQFDKDFEFVLNKKQKNHLIDKSNALTVSGAEVELSSKLLAVQDKLKRKDKL